MIHGQNRIRIVILFLLAAATSSGCAHIAPAADCSPVAASPVAVRALDEAASPLRRDFDRDADHVRVVALVSPTCGECLHGADVVRAEVLAALPDADLRVYFVWLPVLDGDDPAAAARSARKFTDPRATHYFDSDLRLGHAFAPVLGIPERKPDPAAAPRPALAWDVYLVYPRGARWAAPAPPRPDFYMHQLTRLSLAVAPFLDGKVLRERVAGLAASPATSSAAPSPASRP